MFASQLAPYLPIVILVLLVIIVLATGYVKAPPDQAYIISGGGKEPRFVIGSASVRIPYLQRLDKLSLKMLSVDVQTSKTIPTLDYINIMVDAVAVVKVDSDSPDALQRAAQNFLNQDTDYISEMVVNVLEGNLREIIGGMDLKDIMNDRMTFAAKVQENAATDMDAMGLKIVSFNIQNIDDDGLGVIENLGIANTVAIRKDAEVSRAKAEKEIAVAKANAEQEANDAQVTSKTAIAERNNQLALKQAALKSEADTAAAKAEAAGSIEAQRQQKEINTEAVNAEIARADRDAELKQKEVAVREQELAASVRKQAEADRYAAEQKAQADLEVRKRAAEAELYETQKAAEAVRAQGEAEAAAIQAKGAAEAEAIKAKGIAEAEAMDRRAEALKKYGRAALAQQVISLLPEIVSAAAKPVEGIDSLNIYANGGDGDSPVSGVTGIAPASIKAAFDTVKSVTGVDLADVMRSDTIDAKVRRDVSVSVDGAVPTVAAEPKAEPVAEPAADAVPKPTVAE